MLKTTTMLVSLVFSGVLIQSSGAIALSPAELTSALLSSPVTHKTTAGTIACRDPQIAFNEKDWGIDRCVREHMLVDVLTQKRWLNKDESFMGRLFPDRAQECGRKEFPNLVRWNLYDHGLSSENVSCLFIEAQFEDGKVKQYRARYYEHGARMPSIDSDWVK